MLTGSPGPIGVYRPIRLLGRGANSVVYLCLDPDGSEVALKWMQVATPELCQRFEREILTLERIDNVHVVGHRDHGEWEGRPFLVMDYIQGHDLRVYAPKLHQRPPAERYEQVRSMGRTLCEGLEHLHRMGLVHRDVKPSNIIRTNEGQIVLTDFGIVKDLDQSDRTEVGMMIGTVSYAAPEQLDGERVDTRADLFGLGATLYYLLTLQRPYADQERTEGRPPIPPSKHEPGIPADLEAVVLRLMAHRPEHRYSDARSAAYALEQGCGEGVPIAGRQDALRKVAQALRTAESGESICVRPSGPLGAGKGWLADMVRQGARSRGLAIYEVREEASKEQAWAALTEGEPCVVVDNLGAPLPEGVAVIEVPLVPLGLADVRRTVVGIAPKTRDPALVADRLRRLTGGIPGLIVPLISRYTVDSELQIPEVVESPGLVDAFFDGLEIDELDVLGAIALSWPPPDAALIEAVVQVPAGPILEMLSARGIIQESLGEWMLAASLFRSRILDSLPDPEGIQHRLSQHRNSHSQGFDGAPEAIESLIERGRQRGLSGSIHQALDDLKRARDLSKGLESGRLEAESLQRLGLVRMELGQSIQAAENLADATALFRAVGDDAQRRLCHVLRAQISLDLAFGSMPKVLAALDRLMSLEAGSNRRQVDVADGLMHSVWSRVCVHLKDANGRAFRVRAALERVTALDEEWQARLYLNLARAAMVLGETAEALDYLEHAEESAQAFPLLAWWVQAQKAKSDGSPSDLPTPIRAFLNEEEAQNLERLAAGNESRSKSI